MNFQVPTLEICEDNALQVFNSERIRLLIGDIGFETTLRVIEKSKIDFRQYLHVLLVADDLESHSDLRVAYHSIAGVAAMFGADKLDCIASQAEIKSRHADCALGTLYKCEVADAIMQYLAALQEFHIQGLHA